MLTERQHTILNALINEYVMCAAPVGSKTLNDHYEFGYSPATIRNELNYLEMGGFVASPHTSAGRIPTSIGYRAFVDSLFQSKIEQLYPDYVGYYHVSEFENSDLSYVHQIAQTLSSLTDTLSLVIVPDTYAGVISKGMLNLMNQPEFSYSFSLKPVISLLENRQAVRSLSTYADSKKFSGVLIGSEIPLAEFSDVTFIAQSFGKGEEQGIVALVGPTRMHYERNISAVHSAVYVLNQTTSF